METRERSPSALIHQFMLHGSFKTFVFCFLPSPYQIFSVCLSSIKYFRFLETVPFLLKKSTYIQAIPQPFLPEIINSSHLQHLDFEMWPDRVGHVSLKKAVNQLFSKWDPRTSSISITGESMRDANPLPRHPGLSSGGGAQPAVFSGADSDTHSRDQLIICTFSTPSQMSALFPALLQTLSPPLEGFFGSQLIREQSRGGD